MEYGVVKIADDHDFQQLKDMVDNSDDWILEFDTEYTKVWTKTVAESSFKMVKVTSKFYNVSTFDIYDVLQDPDYRKEWDHSMLESVDIGYLNPNNDLCYYAVSVPMPMRNRDFVLQRSWLDTGSEQYIINHSVFHKDYPPRKNYVRAISHFTGYLLRKGLGKNNKDTCDFSYVSRSDPQGVLPSWLVNKCTQIFAPRYVKQLEVAATRYQKWKSSHDPNLKPWYYPEQLKGPRIEIADCVPCKSELEILQLQMPSALLGKLLKVEEEKTQTLEVISLGKKKETVKVPVADNSEKAINTSTARLEPPSGGMLCGLSLMSCMRCGKGSS